MDCFFSKNSLNNFCFYGDFNIDFNSPHHVIKARFFNLAEHIGVNPRSFFCNIYVLNHIRFHHNSFSDYKDVTVVCKNKSLLSVSCPGINSEPKILFEFLIILLPNFIFKVFNNLDTIYIDNSPFRSLKARNVVSIPKKDVK